MCDLKPKTRRRRYGKLIKIGHTPAWARRARDFSEPHYEYHSIHPPGV